MNPIPRRSRYLFRGLTRRSGVCPGLWLQLLFAIVLSLILARAAQAERVPDLSDSGRQELAQMTELADHYDQADVAGWHRIMVEQTAMMTNPFSVKLAVFERLATDGVVERRAVFIGSQDVGSDWNGNNFLEYLKSPFAAHNAEARMMYQQAQGWSAGLVEKADQDHARIEFVGYSRGAFFATAMAGIFNRPATNFNGPTLAAGLEMLNAEQAARAAGRILNIHFETDPVLVTLNVPWSSALAPVYTVAATPANALRAHLDPGYSHSLAPLRESLLSHSEFARVEPVDFEAVNLIAGQMGALAEGLQRIAEARPGAAKAAAGLAKIADFAAKAAEVSGYAAALRKDIEAARDHSLVWVKSATLDAIGTTLLTGSKLNIVQSKLGQSENGLLPGMVRWAQSNGMLKVLGTVDKDMPTFGALDFIGASRDAIVERRFSIATIEKFMDSAVGCSWAIAAFMLTGNLKIAKAAEESGVLLAKAGRLGLAGTDFELDLLRAFDWGRDPFSRREVRLLQMYQDAVDSAHGHGQVPPPWTDFFGGKGPGAAEQARATLRAAGLSKEGFVALEQAERLGATSQGAAQREVTADRSANLLKAAKAAAAAPAKPTPEPGGVDMEIKFAPRLFKAAPGSLGDLRRAAEAAKN